MPPLSTLRINTLPQDTNTFTKQLWTPSSAPNEPGPQYVFLRERGRGGQSCRVSREKGKIGKKTVNTCLGQRKCQRHTWEKHREILGASFMVQCLKDRWRIASGQCSFKVKALYAKMQPVVEGDFCSTRTTSVYSSVCLCARVQYMFCT